MNNLKLIVTTLLLCISFAAMSQDRPQVTIFEAALQDFDMADSIGGTVSFKECDDCTYRRLRITPRTTFQVDDQTMRFEEFRETIRRLELADTGNFSMNVGRDDISGTLAIVAVYTQ